MLFMEYTNWFKDDEEIGGSDDDDDDGDDDDEEKKMVNDWGTAALSIRGDQARAKD